ncbi:MAG: hypothetical protein RLZ33_381 [Bacteroidota bacterium]|jgi:hypothetical protein
MSKKPLNNFNTCSLRATSFLVIIVFQNYIKMKQTYIVIATALLSLIAFGSQAQEVKEVKKEIRKEVNLKEENGEKTLVITTTENGVLTEEVYKGEAAEAKMAEFETKEGEVREEVNVIENNGEKTVTVTKTVNGETTIEVLTGAEADAKLKEMDLGTPQTMSPNPKRTEVKMEKREIQKIEPVKKN